MATTTTKTLAEQLADKRNHLRRDTVQNLQKVLSGLLELAALPEFQGDPRALEALNTSAREAMYIIQKSPEMRVWTAKEFRRLSQLK